MAKTHGLRRIPPAILKAVAAQKKRMRITDSMRRVLTDIAEGRGSHWDCHGQSEHGGRQSILQALYRRGLIGRNYRVTSAGRQLLERINDAN